MADFVTIATQIRANDWQGITQKLTEPIKDYSYTCPFLYF
jgi:hypothetical protein